MIYAPPGEYSQKYGGDRDVCCEISGSGQRRPFAVAAFDPKRERMLLRAERIVELLSSRAIRDGWSFDKNRAARFLHCLRTFDGNDATSTEATEIVNWALDHEQSLLWIFTGNINEMICTLAYHSPGKRQTRVLEGRLRRLAGHQRPCQLRRPVLARAVSRPGVGLCGRDKSGSLAIFDRNSAAPCDAIPPASARCAALPPVRFRATNTKFRLPRLREQFRP